MAVYTRVSDAALQDFLHHYDIGSAVSLKGIAEGVENSNFLLETTKGRYILTLFEKRVDAADLPYFLSLMTFCADAGLPTAPAIAQKNGETLASLCDRPAAVIAFLEGLSVDAPSESHCSAAGSALGDFHLATRDFPGQRANPLSLEGWIALSRSILDSGSPIPPHYATYISDEIAYLRGHWPKNLPFGVTHSDLFADNVLFKGDVISGMIDFYFAADDFLAYDLAVMVNAWCFDNAKTLNKVHAKALISHYDAKRPLTAAETAALPILMRGAALRFFLTRLEDYLNQKSDALVTVKDPADYYHRALVHQGMQDLSDYVL